MSDVHVRDVPLDHGLALPPNMSITANGQIVMVERPHSDSHPTTQLTASDEDSQESICTSKDFQSNGGMVGGIQSENNLPTRVTYTTSSHSISNNVQMINSEATGDPSILLSYSTAVEQADSAMTLPAPSGDYDSPKPCLICGDKGSGFHYSAFSCEGCKGFFKRTIQKSLSYSCKGNSDCVINKYTRNSCQHCRYQRCLEVGMKREAVREDRSPGGKHRPKHPKLDGCVSVPGHVKGKNKPVYQDPLLDSLVQAKPFLIPKVEGNISLDSLSINELMQYGYMELRYIIEWAKKVPGFKGLGVDDQMALLKSAFMELNVLRLSYRSLAVDGYIKFAEGLTVPIDYATSIGWGKELITATADFTSRLRDIFMDETEFSTLNAIVLTYPDAVGIQDKQQVAALQTQMLDSLRKYVNHTYPDDYRRYGKMLLRLPALRTVSAKAAERFLSLTLDGNIQLSALVSEMMS